VKYLQLETNKKKGRGVELQQKEEGDRK
jgi:hypothetical protein